MFPELLDQTIPNHFPTPCDPNFGYRKMMITFRLNNLVSPENQKSSTKGHISTPAEGWNVYLVYSHIKSRMSLSVRDTVTQQPSTGHIGHIRPQVTWHPSLNHILLKALLPTLDLENSTMGWQSRELDSCGYRSIFRFLTDLTREITFEKA